MSPARKRAAAEDTETEDAILEPDPAELELVEEEPDEDLEVVAEVDAEVEPEAEPDVNGATVSILDDRRTRRSTAASNGKPKGREDLLFTAAEILVVKGKEAGFLTPDDILLAFPGMEAEPDQIFRIFNAFKEMGIEVSDDGKEFEEVT
ncbi:MAG: RNA polymerase sigma factor region1.1 domain-containing protein, partial [Candidatus Dormibacteria bacterium]